MSVSTSQPSRTGTGPIRVGIIGYGLSAKVFHIPFLRTLPEYRLQAICSSRTAEINEALPGIKVIEAPSDLCADDDIDLIVITSPNSSHFNLAHMALQHYKHVVVEKPFTTYSGQALELAEYADQQHCCISAFHNRRWDGDFLTACQLMESGRLGNVHVFESRFDRFRPEVRQRWREQPGEGTGYLWDLAPHLIDQALALFGMPHSLTARSLPLRPGATTCDYVHLQLHYPQREVILNASPYMAAKPALRFLIQGDAGSYIKYGLDPQEERLTAGIQPAEPGWNKEDEHHWGVLFDSNGKAEHVSTQPGDYGIYYSKLAKHIRGHGPNPVTATDAAQVIRLIELAELSQTQQSTLELA
ncbi:oxidoreductase [Pokkaliibacter plantistimulans]|uniref:Oxidoreductase n=1 Tax=Proteobacteria bacterium 228 TaxID=2083153 RepID=A0A2S5KSP1_9PROT|nr:oxidoreductase [Pokkaliibacter plantistimulans]PPC77286.1 oxidoreductase [Pokkaliibacter plantistimulans]